MSKVRAKEYQVRIDHALATPKLQDALHKFGDAFLLAREIRLLDMQASPYDLGDLGHPPVAIETPEGKAQYLGRQRAFAERSNELRRRLLAVLDTSTTAAPRVSAEPRRRAPGRR